MLNTQVSVVAGTLRAWLLQSPVLAEQDTLEYTVGTLLVPAPPPPPQAARTMHNPARPIQATSFWQSAGSDKAVLRSNMSR